LAHVYSIRFAGQIDMFQCENFRLTAQTIPPAEWGVCQIHEDESLPKSGFTRATDNPLYRIRHLIHVRRADQSPSSLNPRVIRTLNRGQMSVWSSESGPGDGTIVKCICLYPNYKIRSRPPHEIIASLGDLVLVPD
jgi:hypothetical protein